MSRWSLLRDVLGTGTGLAVIISQVVFYGAWGRAPSAELLGAALALTVPSVVAHGRVLWSGAGGSSSPPSPPPGPPPSGSSPVAADQ